MPVSSAAVSSAVDVYHDLIRINRALRAQSDRGSLSAGSVSALWTVVNHAPLRTTELAARENVATPTMSRIIAALEKQDLVERTADPDDGRVCLIRATPQGDEYIRGATSRRAQLFEQALDRLGPEDRVVTEQAIRGLADAFTALDDQ
ncbi:transcriptional regulator, MarR family [Williamsia sterculiae]|uniref:Transcriptional regulator, MarR family n=1 Tax=Williamsia sterculiae TaxID=1344003 RepID=A0A1N7DFK9_9NOCA|nr:transcriptional regulator, MarR family [Williamsia sterculiae]